MKYYVAVLDYSDSSVREFTDETEARAFFQYFKDMHYACALIHGTALENSGCIEAGS